MRRERENEKGRGNMDGEGETMEREGDNSNEWGEGKEKMGREGKIGKERKRVDGEKEGGER